MKTSSATAQIPRQLHAFWSRALSGQSKNQPPEIDRLLIPTVPLRTRLFLSLGSDSKLLRACRRLCRLQRLATRYAQVQQREGSAFKITPDACLPATCAQRGALARNVSSDC